MIAGCMLLSHEMLTRGKPEKENSHKLSSVEKRVKKGPADSTLAGLWSGEDDLLSFTML